jgi:hypothetical protein
LDDQHDNTIKYCKSIAINRQPTSAIYTDSSLFVYL